MRWGGAIRWKAKDYWLGRSVSGMWKVSTSKVVAPACVGEGPMGWLIRASFERTDRMLVYRPSMPM
jgi:hypothetical protein